MKIKLTLFLSLQLCLYLCSMAQEAGPSVAPEYRAPDSVMATRMRMERAIDSIADLFPKHSSYKDYPADYVSQLTVYGAVPTSVTRKNAGPLTIYIIAMDSAKEDMDIKSVELVLYRDTLVKASVFYDESHGDYWEKWYFHEQACFLSTASPFEILTQTKLDYTNFFALTERLEKAK